MNWICEKIPACVPTLLPVTTSYCMCPYLCQNSESEHRLKKVTSTDAVAHYLGRSYNITNLVNRWGCVL